MSLVNQLLENAIMKSLFPQYYRSTANEFADLFRECVFIFDSNMLLNLYRYPQKPREDLFSILRKISEQGRLWLPFQAALEFQENRLGVIASQKRKFGQVKKLIADIQTEFRKKVGELNLRKRHSAIDPDVLSEDIDKAFQKYITQLEVLESDQLDVHQEDNIRSEIDILFANKVGAPFSQPELDDIFNEGSIRYKARRPPGYEDEEEKKGSLMFHGDLVIKREYGDLIVWKEILRYITESKPKGVVFVTDDRKEDWWLEIGGKTIGPRPELLTEVYSQTGLSAFYVYNSERFMAVSSENLGIALEEDSLRQVKLISQALPRSLRFRRAMQLRHFYDSKCQVCGFEKEVEIAYLVPKSFGGATRLRNLLLLCPNHHGLLDRGVFTIGDDFRLIGIEGQLTVNSNHPLSLKNLQFHRDNIYKPKEEA